MVNTKSNIAWKKIFEEFSILEQINELGEVLITASEIKKYREPRLMSKWDSVESLPPILKKHNINILPVTRGKYILSRFNLYEDFPELSNKIKKMTVPVFQTIDLKKVTSEATAINLISISGILDDFLEIENNIQTFNGRMSTGEFKFSIDSEDKKREISVVNAQCEIDAGFENNQSIIILEAKNIVNKDFNIRQLYYPYRKWHDIVTKPINLVFLVYSNMVFTLYQYEFRELQNFSSINLVKTKSYSLVNTKITTQMLINIYNRVKIKYDDNRDRNPNAPFIQADSFSRIISLTEELYKRDLSKVEISNLMDFTMRQADYYFNAGKYLGLFEYSEVTKEVYLTDDALGLFELDYNDRQLKYVELILQHKIFNELFLEYIFNENISISKVQRKMKELNVCSEKVINRRSSTVISWLEWINNLTKLH